MDSLCTRSNEVDEKRMARMLYAVCLWGAILCGIVWMVMFGWVVASWRLAPDGNDSVRLV